MKLCAGEDARLSSTFLLPPKHKTVIQCKETFNSHGDIISTIRKSRKQLFTLGLEQVSSEIADES